MGDARLARSERSVRDLVRWAARARALGALAVAALAAVAAAGFVRGAIAAEAGAAPDAGWIAAAVAGVLGAASAWLGSRASAGTLVRSIDRALRLEGALQAAHEAERASDPGPVARLLSARVLARVDRRAAARAALPPIAPVAVAALVGLGASALVEGPRGRPGAPSPRAIQRGLESALLRAREHARAPHATGDDLDSMLEEARSLARPEPGGADDGGDDDRRAERILASIERELASLLARSPDDPGLVASLREAQGWAALAGRNAERDSLPRPAGTGPGGRGLAAGDAEEEGPRDRDAGTLTSPPARGTISAPKVDTTVPNSAPTPPPLASDRVSPTGEAAWWPTRHAGIVSRWIDRGRGAERPEEAR